MPRIINDNEISRALRLTLADGVKQRKARIGNVLP